uniref:Uncharacterized protein n=1 Tax=uncultured marine virus TaxID=186617 RepID=A0A0F7LA13_9VIRU|nr:hypothetical protein [uncultured marine virus]
MVLNIKSAIGSVPSLANCLNVLEIPPKALAKTELVCHIIEYTLLFPQPLKNLESFVSTSLCAASIACLRTDSYILSSLKES